MQNGNTVSVQRQIGLLCLLDGSQRKVRCVTNETQNIDKFSYLHGHYLNAVYKYLVFIANPHILQFRLQTFCDVMLCYGGSHL